MASRDYEEFIAELNDHNVRYLIVGAHAVALHARPRATKDLDILIEPSTENADRLLAAMSAFFGGAELGYAAEDILDPEWIVQLGVAPVRIDLISDIPGLPDFPTVWAHRVDTHFGTEDAHFIGLDDLNLREAGNRSRAGRGRCRRSRASAQAALTSTARRSPG